MCITNKGGENGILKETMCHKKEQGFTLVEMVIYIALFGASALFLVGILSTVTKTQLRQSASQEVNQQISFVVGTIERLVRESSLVENDPGVTSATLILRMASSSLDKTTIYQRENMLYLTQGDGSELALTTNKVNVDHFSVTRYQPSGGATVVQIELALEYGSGAPDTRFSKVWRGAMTRVNAATFETSLLPAPGNPLGLGDASNKWGNAYFSGRVNTVGGILSESNIGFTNASAGVLLKAPNGTCYRLGVTNGGVATTTVDSCL